MTLVCAQAGIASVPSIRGRISSGTIGLLFAIRDKVLQTMTGGLRALYRTLELPGKNPLKEVALDAAVLDAYGFSARGICEAK